MCWALTRLGHMLQHVHAHTLAHTHAHTDALGIHLHCCSSPEAAFVFSHVAWSSLSLQKPERGRERESESVHGGGAEKFLHSPPTSVTHPLGGKFCGVPAPDSVSLWGAPAAPSGDAVGVESSPLFSVSPQ